MLKSMVLKSVFANDETRQALSYLRQLKALMEIDLGEWCPMGLDILGHLSAGDFESCNRPAEQRQRKLLFTTLKRFCASVDMQATFSLTMLMPSLTHVTLRQPSDGVSDADDNGKEVTIALASLGKLPQLQALRVRCRHGFVLAHFRSLHGLKQLRIMEISAITSSSATGDALVALLRNLQRLHTLEYMGDMPHLSRIVMRSVSLAGPLLKHITLPCHLVLPPTLEQPELLFPRLETLILDPWERSHDL
jgi:hypothetical protein